VGETSKEGRKRGRDLQAEAWAVKTKSAERKLRFGGWSTVEKEGEFNL